MITIYRADSRGSFKNEWLDTKYTYSFSGYYNPARMGFGDLRVVNDDVVAAKKGFGMHAHENMEIITIVTAGALTHKDSMGNSGVVKAGDVQVMSAGSGVMHSEVNDGKEPVELFQIWIETNKKDVEPRYDQKRLDVFHGDVRQIVGEIGKFKGLGIYQDAKIFAGSVKKGRRFVYDLEKGKGLFVMVVDGEVSINGKALQKRDSAEVVDVEQVVVKALSEARLIVIEVSL